MRLVATRSDVYGPSAGLDMRQTTLAAVPAADGSKTATTQQKATQTALFPALAGSIFAKPVLWLFGFIGILIAYKLIEENRGSREEFQEIKVGLNNVVKVTLMVLVGFAIVKFLSQRYNVPGVSPFLTYATGGNLG